MPKAEYTLTSNYNLKKSIVGGANNQWGTFLNEDLDLIDQTLYNMSIDPRLENNVKQGDYEFDKFVKEDATILQNLVYVEAATILEPNCLNTNKVTLISTPLVTIPQISGINTGDEIEFEGDEPGLVPQATINEQTLFLKGDGTWGSPLQEIGINPAIDDFKLLEKITAYTQAVTDSSDKIATTAFVKNVLENSEVVLNIGDGNKSISQNIQNTSEALSTTDKTSLVNAINELKTEQADIITTINNNLSGNYAPINSPNFTGTPLAPTATIPPIDSKQIVNMEALENRIAQIPQPTNAIDMTGLKMVGALGAPAATFFQPTNTPNKSMFYYTGVRQDANIWMYNIQEKKVTEITSMPSDQTVGPGLGMYNGNIYVVGGSNGVNLSLKFSKYSTLNRTWSNLGNIPDVPGGNSGQELGGHVTVGKYCFMAGGKTTPSTVRNIINVLDMETEIIQRKAFFPYDFAYCKLEYDFERNCLYVYENAVQWKIFIIGGLSSNININDLVIKHTIELLPAYRHNVGDLAYYNDTIFLIGGSINKVSYASMSTFFNTPDAPGVPPTNLTWQSVDTPAGKTIGYHSAHFIWEDKLFICNGSLGQTLLCLDLKTKTWIDVL